MVRNHRVSTIGALIVCLVGPPCDISLFASDEGTSSEATSSQSAFNADPLSGRLQRALTTPGSPAPLAESLRSTLNDAILRSDALDQGSGMDAWRRKSNLASSSFSGAAQFGRRGRRHGRHGAAAAVAIGAAATIAGAAVLLYANRPECGTNPNANACGYGTKVVGGAVLTGGVVGLVVGAATWR
jgi:hypothetical protein